MEDKKEQAAMDQKRQEAIAANRIILFANQKGGAGKTTLCAMFANHLSALGFPVAVLDADTQQTFYRRRKTDLRHVGDNKKPPYNVQAINIDGRQSTRGILAVAKNMKGTVLIDSPGSLTQEGLVELVPNCDVIICPYHYDLNTIDSTTVFLSIVFRILLATKGARPKFIFISNNNDPRVGKSNELRVWKATDEFFAKYGKVAPPINSHADIQHRWTTFDNSGVNELFYKACFDFLVQEIYDIEPKEDDHE